MLKNLRALIWLIRSITIETPTSPAGGWLGSDLSNATFKLNLNGTTLTFSPNGDLNLECSRLLTLNYKASLMGCDPEQENMLRLLYNDGGTEAIQTYMETNHASIQRDPILG